MVIFFLLVSLDPVLACEGDTADGAAELAVNAVAAAQFGGQERMARAQPPSPVPKLHVLPSRRFATHTKYRKGAKETVIRIENRVNRQLPYVQSERVREKMW